MKPQRSCPDCGSPLPPDAPEGICPECLMKTGMELSQNTTISVEPIDTAEGRNLPNPGDQFGEYRIERVLGRGGMGAVYEAEQLETGRRVALKVLTHRLDSAEARARFFREGRLAASINHPNSVYVYGTGEIEGTPAIVMELVKGSTLEERVKRDGPFPVGNAVDAIIDVISGLQAAQATGILHRDIKPSNCFEDADGTVKVGDFGLSISSEAREEIELSRKGMFLGTPAFSSPEQLRGEELNARSDLYSVGVTLFYLLTGRTPFEGNTTAQLFANVLEKVPPSPKDFRPEIPEELARVVLRCLEKTPGERFRNYHELHRALMPFGTDAPAPAPLPRRFAAGLIDNILVSIFLLWAITYLLTGGTSSIWELERFYPLRYLGVMSLQHLVLVGYYALLEGRWGCSIGKALCRLQLVDDHRNPPGFGKAGLRAVLFLIIPYIPFCIFFGLVAASKVNYSYALILITVAFPHYLLTGLFFSTARKRNGLAGLHDLVSRTRVIRKTKLATRPALAPSDIQPVKESESMPRIGAYYVLEKLGRDHDGQWLLAYDARLLRKIWIREAPPGAPEVPNHQRALGRIGRLRWIAGRRSGEENWDAFEAPTGAPFLDLVSKPQSWEFVRFWLLDIAKELAAAAKDGTTPKTLSLDRVWINTEGRAKLLDFPAPGLNDSKRSTRAFEPELFLNEVASSALEGHLDRPAENSIAAPVPLHARRFLEDKKILSDPETAAQVLKRLIQRPARVTRRRRAALLACCLVLPVFFSCIAMISMNMVRKQPDLMELNRLLSDRQRVNKFLADEEASRHDRLRAIYIAHHYKDTVKNPEIWNSWFAMLNINQTDREFVEQSIRDHPKPTEAEIDLAETLSGWVVGQKDMGEEFLYSLTQPVRSLVTVGSLLLWIVAIPSMITALCFRGGLVLLVIGVGVVRKDGRIASRGRVFLRSVITWVPLYILTVVMSAVALNRGSLEPHDVILVTLIAAGVAAWSTLQPDRGIPDRLSGTRLVPR
jgi:eukaryotic-like serine/threonine-protein kinase